MRVIFWQNKRLVSADMDTCSTIDGEHMPWAALDQLPQTASVQFRDPLHGWIDVQMCDVVAVFKTEYTARGWELQLGLTGPNP